MGDLLGLIGHTRLTVKKRAIVVDLTRGSTLQ
jgi:hypothetical protein